MQIPEMSEGAFYDALARWEKMSRDLKALKVKEILLRQELFGVAFPKPEEGTMYYALGGGWRLQAKHTINRELDVANITPMREAMAKMGASIDPLINWKPVLKVTAYKKLDPNVRELFDNIVTAKPGTPQMELVPPTDKQAEEATNPPASIPDPVGVETAPVTIEVATKKKATSRKKKTT